MTPTRLAQVVLIGFLLMQMACQMALLVERLAPLRVIFRTAAFGMSLVALLAVSGFARAHPSRSLLLAALATVAISIFYTSTNTPLAGIAQFLLYLAIAGPVFWVPRLTITPRLMERVVLVLWSFHTLSATVGVLQATFPGSFQPALSSVVQAMGDQADGLKVRLADGAEIWRPSGLTDVPGGAAAAGLYAVLFGMGYVAVAPGWGMRSAGAVGMTIGLFCIYLAQVRVTLVVVAILAFVFLSLLAAVGRYGDMVRLFTVLIGVTIGSFAWAYAIGGESVSRRLETLVEDKPTAVYYSNRGYFLEETVNELAPEYPFGAGLGRWGMTRLYFGDESNPASPPIWVEIQWTAWVLDGGLPLALLYSLALIVAIGTSVRVMQTARDPLLVGWAALVVAFDVAVFCTTFSYVPFIGQPGLEFWLLNAVLFTAWSRAR